MSAIEAPTRQIIEPEEFLKIVRDDFQLGIQEQSAKDARAAHWQRAKARGVDIVAWKMLEKLRKLNPAEAKRTYENIKQYQQILGLNFLEQGDLFSGGLPPEVTASVQSMAALIGAEMDGFAAGKSGRPGDHDANPYRDNPGPGSEIYVAWTMSWRNGAEERTRGGGVRDIEPKADGDGFDMEDPELPA